jgi:hypothetical protein
LLLCQAFFASEPLEGLRIGHSHMVFSFRVMFVPSLEVPPFEPQDILLPSARAK